MSPSKEPEQVMTQEPSWEREFEESFGAVFSFPPNANNATAHIKGSTGVSQAYAGRYDTHTIKSFIKEQLALQREEILGEASIHVGNQIKTALALQKEKMMGVAEEMKKKMKDKSRTTDEKRYPYGYNRALTDLQTKINKELWPM